MMNFQSNGWFKGKLVRNLEIARIEAMNVTNANTNQEDLTLQDWQSDDNGQNSYLINSTRIIKRKKKKRFPEAFRRQYMNSIVHADGSIQGVESSTKTITSTFSDYFPTVEFPVDRPKMLVEGISSKKTNNTGEFDGFKKMIDLDPKKMELQKIVARNAELSDSDF